MKTADNIIEFTPSEETPAIPQSPFSELLWDAEYFVTETLCSVLEQIKILETTAWFRERDDDLSKHRASNMQAVSDRRAAHIIGGWLETRATLEKLKAAVLRSLETGNADLEQAKATVIEWTPEMPAAQLLAVCGEIDAALGIAHGPRPASAAIPAKEGRATAELKANPARYGRDPEFLGRIRDLCMPAA